MVITLNIGNLFLDKASQTELTRYHSVWAIKREDMQTPTPGNGVHLSAIWPLGLGLSCLMGKYSTRPMNKV